MMMVFFCFDFLSIWIDYYILLTLLLRRNYYVNLFLWTQLLSICLVNSHLLIMLYKLILLMMGIALLDEFLISKEVLVKF